MPPELFQQKLLAWFDLNGRKDLPWQQDITPYKVWLSEIMLQQTQVTTVIPYFNKFIRQYPDIHCLASTSIDSVLALWSGLGYYARARNLHKTAVIVSKNKGVFPDHLSSLMNLPGIGQSTAGAILSIAFNNSHPILDGNVRRVFARFNAISGWTGSAKVSKELWRISTQFTPINRCAAYTQAIMDLGATVCTRSRPRCSECPLNTACIARIKNIVNDLPTPKPVKKLPVKQIFFLILRNKQAQFFLEKRPTSGIWGGLWSFPEFATYSEIESWCLEKNMSLQSVNRLEEQRHTFSHYHLDYTGIIINTETLKNNVLEDNQSVWYKMGQNTALGLPTPIQRLINQNKE